MSDDDFDPVLFRDAMRLRCNIRPAEEGGCWIFQPTQLTPGWETKYAVVKYRGKTMTAMRAMFLVASLSEESFLKPGQEIRHITNKEHPCHKRCVNPDHLEIVQLLVPRKGRYKNSKRTEEEKELRDDNGKYKMMTPEEERAVKEQKRRDHGHKKEREHDQATQDLLDRLKRGEYE